jgi:hypothetical protein
MGTGRQGHDKLKRNSMTHREYVVDRSQRIADMARTLHESEGREQEFFDDPIRVAREFGVNLTSEEVFGIRLLRGVSLIALAGKLKPVAFFNNNCGCAGGATPSDSLLSSRRLPTIKGAGEAASW